VNDDEPLLQRFTISVDIDYEPGYQHVAAAILVDVLGHLAHDGIEVRWARLEITGPTTTP
jgi:hypothetical protein